MKVGFGVSTEDRFTHRTLGTLNIAQTGQTSDLPVANASNGRVRMPWEIRRVLGGTPGTLLDYGWFEIDETNRYIDLREAGSGSDTVITLDIGQYNGTELATEIQSKMAGVDGGLWRCSWGISTGIFTIYNSNTSAGTMANFKWKTGAHGTDNADNNIAKEIGFREFPDYTGADSGNTFDIAGEARHFTHTWVEFRGYKGSNIQAQMVALNIDPLPDDVADPRVDVSDVKVFACKALSGSIQDAHTRANLEAVSDWDASFSAQPGEEMNRLRIATFGYASNDLTAAKGSNWVMSWRHWDTMSWRHVNLLKAFPARWDSSATNRTIQQLSDHGIYDESPSLGIKNYYPVAVEERWRVTMDFGQWEAATLRSVIHTIVREGKHTGLLWALRLDEIASGAVTGASEADKGFLLWGALTDYSLDTYSGAGSDYISATMSMEQIR